MQLTKLFIIVLLLPTILFAQNTNLKTVGIQLNWKHQFQFAGFYVAKEKGFYQKAGLDVTIKEYDHSINVVDKVISGNAAYGVGRSSLLIERSNGKPVVALGAIYQRSPSILITTNPAIKSPKDLHGKKVMVTDDAAQSASITTMLLSNGISKDDFTLQKHSFDYMDLIEHNTDAMACYLSNEPYHLEKKKITYTIFDPKEYGYDFYGDILFTSEDEIANNTERVKAFYTASRKGWLSAFENIEETAQLIYEKYNTQNKSLESLIYEGQILKELALIEGINFGHISKNKFKEIAKVYHLGNLLDKVNSLDEFIDPLGLNKEHVKIGVLAKRGAEATLIRWKSLAEHLSEKLEAYHFTIIPLDFTQLSQNIAEDKVDFFITNPMYYVQLEHTYGVSRIATLLNSDSKKKHQLKEFGGVIFTKSDNKHIKRIEDIDGKSFGAVNERSFGGWVMAYEELVNHGMDKNDVQLMFLNTHDAVVKAVLDGSIDAGTVRTDTLERMAFEGKIDLSDIKVINPQSHESFPYLVSTKLYPEWPFAKLKHTSDNLANHVVLELVNISSDPVTANKIKTSKWTVPLDYTSVHTTLNKLHIAPHDFHEVHIIDVLQQYTLIIYSVALVIILLIVRLLYIRKVNRNLDSYNHKLDQEVKERTGQLEKANKNLKILAQTDPLTGISNRGYFMKQGKNYFDIAVRNKTPLQMLSLDLDYFKNINDSYGHQAGDQVLKEFTKIIEKLLRESDLFGRIGGEEFCIILQSTSIEGAKVFAERVRKSIEAMQVMSNNKMIEVTVSIGLAALTDEAKIENLLKKSDVALYRAKKSGRNQLITFN